MIILRITLESELDVIREFIINEKLNLEELHLEIIKIFNLDKFEMASFFLTDDNLNLLQEITLVETEEENNMVMKNVKITSILNASNPSIIYIYDFMNMWRFHIQFVKKENLSYIEQTKCLYSKGNLPQEAPKIIFENTQ